MGKTGSGLASQVGTDTDSEGIVEVDPTQRYLRVCYRLFVFSLLCSYISFFFLMKNCSYYIMICSTVMFWEREHIRKCEFYISILVIVI
jgi:hypothetical protein